MTTTLKGQDVAQAIERGVPSAVEASSEREVYVKPSEVLKVAWFVKNDPALRLEYLNSLTAVDYIDYFEVVYHLTSLKHNHRAVLKAKVYGRESLSLPSVVAVWQGADFQEREVWDLMGVGFEGHPNMKRIMLWEGFDGHPLRRDYLPKVR